MYNFNGVQEYTAHRLLLYEGVIKQLSSDSVDLYLFYDGLVHMQIMYPSNKKSV